MSNSAGCVACRPPLVDSAGRRQPGAGLRARMARLLARLRRWRVLARQRRELAELSDRMLKDIGLSRVDALREARRPFWDDPRASPLLPGDDGVKRG